MGLHKVEHIHKLYFTYLHISYTNFIYTYIHLYTHTHIYIYVHGCLWRIFCLMMWQMFSIGEKSELQVGQFSTRTLLVQSHAVVIAAVCGFAFSCWNTQGIPWNRRRLEGSICCVKTFVYLSAFIVPSKACKLPILYALMHPHFIRDAGFWTECWTSEGPKTTGIQQRSLALSLMHRDFSSFSEFFDGVMHCRWWNLQKLCNLTLRNVVFKVFHNLFTHSFTDWRDSAHLYIWETLPL